MELWRAVDYQLSLLSLYYHVDFYFHSIFLSFDFIFQQWEKRENTRSFSFFRPCVFSIQTNQQRSRLIQEVKWWTTLYLYFPTQDRQNQFKAVERVNKNQRNKQKR